MWEAIQGLTDLLRIVNLGIPLYTLGTTVNRMVMKVLVSAVAFVLGLVLLLNLVETRQGAKEVRP